VAEFGLTDAELQLIWAACCRLRAGEDPPEHFRTFLVDNLTRPAPDLAARVQRFSGRQLVALWRHIRQHLEREAAP
jgi:hypothetical protein